MPELYLVLLCSRAPGHRQTEKTPGSVSLNIDMKQLNIEKNSYALVIYNMPVAAYPPELTQLLSVSDNRVITVFSFSGEIARAPRLCCFDVGGKERCAFSELEIARFNENPPDHFWYRGIAFHPVESAKEGVSVFLAA